MSSNIMNHNFALAEPFLIEGGSHTDDRGDIEYFNELDILKEMKRMYFVSNHMNNFIRAWHGHKYESKLIKVVSGVAIIGVCELDFKHGKTGHKPPKIKWDSKKKFVMCGSKGQMLYVPAGWANGAKTIKANTKIMYLSDKTVDESKKDDYRFPLEPSEITGFWGVIQR